MSSQRDMFSRRTPAPEARDVEPDPEHSSDAGLVSARAAFHKPPSPTPHRLSIDVDDGTYARLLAEKARRALGGETVTIVAIVRAAVTEHLRLYADT